MKTIALLNRKGGVGKTTCALNLAKELDRAGLMVLLIDLDAQTDLTHFLTKTNPQQGGRNQQVDILAVLKSRISLSDAAHKVPGTNNLHLVPGSKNIEEFDFEHSQQVLRDHLKEPGLSEVDLVLIDCPSTLNQAVYCGLHASDFALLVTEPELPSMNNLRDSLDIVKKIGKGKHSRLQPLGILVNRVDLRRSITKENLATLRRQYPDLLIPSTISVDSAIVSSYNHQQFVRDYSYPARCVMQFSRAAAEILNRLGIDVKEASGR